MGQHRRCFVLRWWDVVAVPVQAVFLGPRTGSRVRVRVRFDIVDVVPAGRVGAVDAFGRIEPVRRFGQRIVVGIDDGPDRRAGVNFLQTLGKSHRRELTGTGDLNESTKVWALSVMWNVT